MTEKSIMLSIVETEEGMEVHINEKAYGNANKNPNIILEKLTKH